MKVRKFKAGVFIIIPIIIGSLIFGYIYSSGFIAIVIKPDLFIESASKGPNTEFGTLIYFNLSLTSNFPFHLTSGSHFSCTFKIKILNSLYWSFNNSLPSNCPNQGYKLNQAGSYKTSVFQFLISVNSNLNSTIPSEIGFLPYLWSNSNIVNCHPFYAKF